MKRITVNGTWHRLRRGGGLMVGIKLGFPVAVVPNYDRDAGYWLMEPPAYYMWSLSFMLLVGTITFHIKTRKVGAGI